MLDWLCGSPRRFKVFVGNRVSEIMDSIPLSCWRHMLTENNPADCASRELSPADLLQFELWWKGPPWLMSDAASWPTTKEEQPQEVTEELKISLTSVAVSEELLIPFNKFSSYNKLVRVMAWILRFAHNINPQREIKYSGHLTVPELQKAESSQIVGQLPRERVTPGHVFDQVGVDYAGPLMLKLGHPIQKLQGCCMLVRLWQGCGKDVTMSKQIVRLQQHCSNQCITLLSGGNLV